MNYNLILKITESFYEIAKKDFLIGYHFRVIEDFDEHIPRIADFWNLQLKGEMNNRNHLPFDLFNVHEVLKINKGEVGRWMILFQNNLQVYLDKKEITQEEFNLWIEKADFFKDKLLKMLFRP